MAHLLEQRLQAARRSEDGAPHRLEAGRESLDAAQQRARVNAWCSQVHAVLLPRPVW
jgi:hypothetical protein